MIKFQDVYKTYEVNRVKVEALRNINLTIEKGDIFGIIGSSGAGKSSLLRTVNLLERPTSGSVLVDGIDLGKLSGKAFRDARKKIGMIFQHFNLLNSKTVYQNVALPLQLSKENKQLIDQRVKETLAFVGLADKLDRYPNELSGGQKQRVSIARALVSNPSILLCDEATSALDPETTSSILQLLKKINQAYQITIVMITHEMEVVREICRHVAVMEEGEIIEVASVFDMMTKPQSRTAKRFVQSIMDEALPDSIIADIEMGKCGRIYRFTYLEPSAQEPIISMLSKQFNLSLNILSGKVTDIQGKAFGNLLIELKGERSKMDEALQIAKDRGVVIEEVRELGN